MGKLPFGVPNKHVLESQGGDSDIMNFYCTTNATTFGQKWSKFQPRKGRHTGTGYLSNFRPGVYYNERIDELDNPVMGHIVADNYHSVTEKSFKPYRGADGTEPLPNTTKQVGSGFVRQKPLTVPTAEEVRKVCIDTRVATAPVEVSGRHKPRLHTLNPKDPVELENAGYGPGYMTTETHQRFQGSQPDRKDVSRKSVGYKEGSGFTHAQNLEPITYHSDQAHVGDVPGWYTDRPTGVSIMKTHFRPSVFPMGEEPLPRLANRSDQETGFTSGTKAHPEFLNRVMSDAYDKAGDIPPARLDKVKKSDPTEFINMTNPNNHSSIAKVTFRGQQAPTPSEADRLGRRKVGSKELTGYCENNDHYVHTSDNPARFITHYSTRYLDRTPKGLEREGHTWGGIQPQPRDGFTRSTQVHDNGPTLNTTATLRNLEPYVARSVKARDAFYNDHTYDSKVASSVIQRPTTVY